MNTHFTSEMLIVPISKDDHIEGLLAAPANLVEYGDYECPYCGEAHPIVKAIQKAMGDQLCFAFRNFPLTNAHPHAEHAAETAEAAGAQGHFWEMHDTLFENQEALEDENLVEYAEGLGLKVEPLMEEVFSGAHAKRIRHDFMSGVRSGVNGTPTFFMNGRRYDGPRDPEMMIAALTELDAS